MSLFSALPTQCLYASSETPTLEKYPGAKKLAQSIRLICISFPRIMSCACLSIPIISIFGIKFQIPLLRQTESTTDIFFFFFDGLEHFCLQRTWWHVIMSNMLMLSCLYSFIQLLSNHSLSTYYCVPGIGLIR